MKRPLPYEAREAAVIVSSGCSLSRAEMDAMPQSQLERLVLVREILQVIEFGLEVDL